MQIRKLVVKKAKSSDASMYTILLANGEYIVQSVLPIMFEVLILTLKII